MEIILLKEVDNVGDKHEIVKVKPGYARNFLIPRGLAIIANGTNRRQLAELQRQDEVRESKRLGHYQELADKVKESVLKIGAKAGTSGKIFGSVTSIQIVQALKDQLEIEVERKKIEMPEEVKEIGQYTAKINFHPEVVTEIRFEVVEE
ncbi:MAG: 50S ribosomal protein L9 [Saprospiraceae bacterium]|nr:50S ribosomal protein L9 [Saprospiraceae bacterium]